MGSGIDSKYEDDVSPRVQATAEPVDMVSKPPHYTGHPSGIECIQVTEHMGFNLGNALKYIWRCDLKQNAIEDLRKAQWYLEREIEKRTKGNSGSIY